jgi:hypothetical protein
LYKQALLLDPGIRCASSVRSYAFNVGRLKDRLRCAALRAGAFSADTIGPPLGFSG